MLREEIHHHSVSNRYLGIFCSHEIACETLICSLALSHAVHIRVVRSLQYSSRSIRLHLSTGDCNAAYVGIPAVRPYSKKKDSLVYSCRLAR